MRLLGIPIESPQTVANRIASDIASIARLARSAPAQLDRMLELGEEIIDRATEVVQTGNELINVLPTLERALDMATPLEGAIDRFGRFVDRLPGGGARSRAATNDPNTPRGLGQDSPADPAPDRDQPG